MAEAPDVSGRTMFRAKRRYAEERVGSASTRQPAQPVWEGGRQGGSPHLIALACSLASDGHYHLTLRAIAGKAVELGPVKYPSHARCGRI